MRAIALLAIAMVLAAPTRTPARALAAVTGRRNRPFEPLA